MSDAVWLDDLAKTLIQRALLPPEGELTLERLTGGVSSDIWKISRCERSLVAKRALARLKVAQDWRAPVSRNLAEVRWLEAVHAIVPGAVPEILHHDGESGLFVMDYIPPQTAPVWKVQLLGGAVDAGFAANVGRILGRIHESTLGRPNIAASFANASTFRALRLSPYLDAAAEANPTLAARIDAIARQTDTCRLCLIHGDVSPKNILAGPHGPIFLDAECATCGDPAFDLAFCLNHLLLKGMAIDRFASLADAFAALVEGYRAAATFARDDAVEARAAALLPALLLARVDGKSPVEYITREQDRVFVRDFATRWLNTPAPRLETISCAWWAALSERAR